MDPTFLAHVKAELAKIRPSQFELVSKETGVPVGTIRKIHYGEVADPRVGTVQALHDFFQAGGLDTGRASAEAA